MADPILITVDDRARESIQRCREWLRDPYAETIKKSNPRAHAKFQRIAALRNDATAADVNKIGSPWTEGQTWAHADRCTGCGERARAVVQVGEEPEYESSTAILCRPCVEKALALFDGVKS